MSSFPELTTTSTPQASGPRTNASHLLVSRTARLQCTRTIIVAYDSLYIVITAAAPRSQPTAMYTASPKTVHLLCLRSNSSQTSADLDIFLVQRVHRTLTPAGCKDDHQPDVAYTVETLPLNVWTKNLGLPTIIHNIFFSRQLVLQSFRHHGFGNVRS